MDQRDRQLLYYLDINARIKESLLAKKLRISKQQLNYRLHRLVSQGIIVQFQTILNLSKLGVPIWANIYFKLKKGNENEILNYLIQNKNVGYVAQLGGRYDLSIVLVAKTIQQLETEVSELTQKYPELNDYLISLRTSGHRFHKKYLLQKKEDLIERDILPKEFELLKIDELDHKILKILAKNSRTPMTKISRELKVPFSTIRFRAKQLEKNKIIAGYSILIDLQKLDYKNFKILLTTRDKSAEVKKRIFSFAGQHKNIIQVFQTLSSHNFELRVETTSFEDYQSILKEIRSAFEDVLEETETLIVFKELKEDFSVVLEQVGKS